MIDSSPALETATRTERGLRPVNEDSVLSRSLSNGRWLAAVADGMGGMQAGEVASRTAIDVLLAEVERGEELVDAVEAAHRAILGQSTKQLMGTTLVAALIDRSGLQIASVGDSRAYLLGPAGLVQVTKDHTVGAEATERGAMGAEHVVGTRWGRALTRSLGTAESLEVDRFGPFRLEQGIRLLLCSDGVHGVLSDESIETHLTGVPDIDAAVDRLIDAALDQGSQDNVSAVLVQFGSVNGARQVEWFGGDPTDGQPEKMASTVEVAEGETDAPADPVQEAFPNHFAGFEAGLTSDSREPGPTDSRRWDLATLVTRSQNPMRRKPGRLQALMLVVALLVTVVAIVSLIRMAES